MAGGNFRRAADFAAFFVFSKDLCISSQTTQESL